MPPLWPNSVLFLQRKSRIFSWTSTEIICFILILVESRFWPEFFSVSSAEISFHWRLYHYGWVPECAEQIFFLSLYFHHNVCIWFTYIVLVFNLSAHLVSFTVIFYLFSNSVQLRKVTQIDRTWQAANIFCTDLFCGFLCFGFDSFVYQMGCLFKCLFYIRAFSSNVSVLQRSIWYVSYLSSPYCLWTPPGTSQKTFIL